MKYVAVAASANLNRSVLGYRPNSYLTC